MFSGIIFLLTESPHIGKPATPTFISPFNHAAYMPPKPRAAVPPTPLKLSGQ